MRHVERKWEGMFALICLLLLMPGFSTVAYGEEVWGMKPGHGPTQGEFPPPPGGHLLSKAIHDHMAAEVLVEITGKSLEEVTAEMADTHMMQVLVNNSIDPDTLKTRMDAKMVTATEKAASCGLITAQQAADILAQIE